MPSGAVSAIKCYSCTARDNEDACGDVNFSSTETIEELAGIECNYCTKTKTKVSGKSFWVIAF